MDIVDERAIRVKSLLSSYYGPTDSAAESDAERGHGGAHPAPLQQTSNMDSVHFDHNAYVSTIIRECSIPDLLQRHVSCCAQVKNLDSDMQMLVYENYNKFIAATHTISRMKDNVATMEANVETLLTNITAVQQRSHEVNSSLSERRQTIEELNGTRNLLRKVQFVFDLPRRLRKYEQRGDYASAVRAYVSSLPVLQSYGEGTFQLCKKESEAAIDGIITKLKKAVMDELSPPADRAQASVLLQQLNEPVAPLMEEYLAKHWDQLRRVISMMDDESQATFLTEFEQTARNFRQVFPMGEQRLHQAARQLLDELLDSVQRLISSPDESVQHLCAVVDRASKNVSHIHFVLPTAGLMQQALQAVSSALSQYAIHSFSQLTARVTATLAPAPSLGQKPLKALLEASHRTLVQGSLQLINELGDLMEASAYVLGDWTADFVELICSELHALFAWLNHHFSTLTAAPAVSPGLILVLARLTQMLDQTAVPRLNNALSHKFGEWERPGRRVDSEAGFNPLTVCQELRLTAESFLQQYVDAHVRQLSSVIRIGMSSPDWLKHQEPTKISPAVERILQLVDSMEDEVEQLLPPGADRSLAYRTSRNSPEPFHGVASFRDGGRGGDARSASRGRTLLLERDVAKLFAQKLELFTKLDFTQSWVVSTVVKMSLKSLHEYTRVCTFGRNGFQQMQLDTFVLRGALRSYVDEETAVDALLDEVSVAITERCLDVVSMEMGVMDKILSSKALSS